MSVELATIIAGIISGALGGTLAIIGAVLAVQKGVRDLEGTEIRRLRVECITNLYGLRYAITDGFAARAEDQARFMFEINRAGALFADDVEILRELRDFYEEVRAKKADATARLVVLIKKMGRKTSLNLHELGDSDVRSTFTLPNTNTVVQFFPVSVVQAPGVSTGTDKFAAGPAK